MPQTWPELSATTLTEQVYEVLRDRIISGAWSGGHFIREQEISTKLGVSRTPVREALSQLSADGFLERIPRRGFRIPEQSATDLLDLYPILAALEALAAEQAFPRINKGALKELRSINDSYRAAYALADTREGIELNNRFHNSLSEGSNNQKLCEIIRGLQAESLWLEFWAFSNISQWDVSIREHDEILDAIESSDYEAALKKLKNNRLMTHKDFLAFTGS